MKSCAVLTFVVRAVVAVELALVGEGLLFRTAAATHRAANCQVAVAVARTRLRSGLHRERNPLCGCRSWPV